MNRPGPDGALRPMSAQAGIGLKPAHYHALLAEKPAVGFLELHVENYMGPGGPPHRYLEALADVYPLSFHGVAMSLGGADPLDRDHLGRWRALVERYRPVLVSEHVAWSRHDGVALHDLLPIPYTWESLRVLCAHVDEVQNVLGRQLLIENPSRYLDFRGSEMPETEFLMEAARRTGCSLLLDVNNVYVSTHNQAEDPQSYLDAIAPELVGEIHLAGHAVKVFGERSVLIDDHGSPVTGSVLALYRRLVARTGRRPTLIEWDTAVPALHVLLDDARLADKVAAEACPAVALALPAGEGHEHAVAG